MSTGHSRLLRLTSLKGRGGCWILFLRRHFAPSTPSDKSFRMFPDAIPNEESLLPAGEGQDEGEFMENFTIPLTPSLSRWERESHARYPEKLICRSTSSLLKNASSPRRKPGSRLLKQTESVIYWIPAFAGMTDLDDFRTFSTNCQGGSCHAA